MEINKSLLTPLKSSRDTKDGICLGAQSFEKYVPLSINLVKRDRGKKKKKLKKKVKIYTISGTIPGLQTK